MFDGASTYLVVDLLPICVNFPEVAEKDALKGVMLVGIHVIIPDSRFWGQLK